LGTLSGYKPKKLADCLKSKLGVNLEGGHELGGWYYLDGKKILRVTSPKGHSREISPGYVNKIIGNLRLDKKEFQLLYECPMKGADYEQKIRGLIRSGNL